MAKEKEIPATVNDKPGTINAVYTAATDCRFSYYDQEFCLTKGESYELPAASEFVQSLLGQNILQTTKS